MRGVGVTGGTDIASRTSGAVTAARLRRPSWRDPRLAVGVVLVLASVAAGVAVVSAADDSVPVYAARDTLPPGTALSSAGLDVVRVRLDRSAGLYLAADSPPAPDAVAVRTVGAGELVPLSAVAGPEALDRRPVAVPVQGPLPADLAAGALVDVWIAATGPGARDGDAAPEKALSGVEVYAVDTGGGGLAAVATASVAILLDDDGTARVLRALANGHRVDLVPVPGTGAGPGTR